MSEPTSVMTAFVKNTAKLTPKRNKIKTEREREIRYIRGLKLN